MVKIFISHSWDRGQDAYEDIAINIKRWIREEAGEITDLSVPSDRRIRSWTNSIPGVLASQIADRIKKCDMFVFIAHPDPSEWMAKEFLWALNAKRCQMLCVKAPGYRNMASFIKENNIPWVEYDMRSVRAEIRGFLSDLRADGRI